MAEIKHTSFGELESFHLTNGTEVYSVHLSHSAEQSRSDCEAEAEQALVKYLYGEEAELRHRETGEPYVQYRDRVSAISLSHSKDRLCLARSVKEVSGTTLRIGVDTEHIQERLFRLKEKFLCEQEQAGLNMTTEALTLCWCAKEAVYKIIGSKAGYMGENIILHTEEIAGYRPFTAYCCGERFRLTPMLITDEEVIVVATSLCEYSDWFRREHEKGKHHLAVLLDPDKTPISSLPTLCKYIHTSGISCILVGGSGYEADIEPFVEALQGYCPSVPVILFPGSPSQLTAKADAMLLLSLISGQDPTFLIGQHIEAAKKFRKEIIETVPTGYILISGGRKSSVERVSGTAPLSDCGKIVDTAYAGVLLGMNMIYLEAGSGAKVPVPANIINAVRRSVDVPLIVGGGICTIEQMKAAFRAGADIVVIGNHFEQYPEDIISFGVAINQPNKEI